MQVTSKGGLRPLESFDGKFVYYAAPGGRQIWKLPVGGGQEALVLEKGARALWTLTESGIYLLEPDAKPGPLIEFFSFATGERSQVMKLPTEPDAYIWGSYGALAVSPDGRWILYEQRDRYESDIMLAENFR